MLSLTSEGWLLWQIGIMAGLCFLPRLCQMACWFVLPVYWCVFPSQLACVLCSTGLYFTAQQNYVYVPSLTGMYHIGLYFQTHQLFNLYHTKHINMYVAFLTTHTQLACISCHTGFHFTGVPGQYRTGL